MQKSNEDCFYFLTSSCSKGMSCSFRHNPSAITCNVTCPAWQRGNCQDPACVLRHSNVQRPSANSGILCLYEKRSMGCLKPDCTFVHARPRPNGKISNTFRPSTTNLINKEAVKLPATPPPPSPNSNPMVASPSVPKVEPPVTVVAPPPPPPPVAVEKKVETPLRSVITGPSEKLQNEAKLNGNGSLRSVASRNVVVAAEPANNSNRTIVHAPSHRVVVSSQEQNKAKYDSDSDIDLEDSIEPETNGRTFNTPIDILFPCSAPSITGRMFVTSKQPSPSPSTNNDNKPIRVNRDRLPATKISIGNNASGSSNEKTISAGTGLPDNDERLNNRLERFKNKPNSPPRNNAGSFPSTTSTHVAASREVVSGDRKRPSTQPSTDESPPNKRLSTSATIGDLYSPPSSSRRAHTRHHHRRSSPSPPPPRISPPRPMSSYAPSPTMNQSDWQQEVDKFLAKTTQPKRPPQLMPLLSIHPRFTPMQQPIAPPRPPYHQNRVPRPRQVSATFFKRASAPGSSNRHPVPPPPRAPPAMPVEAPAPTLVVPRVPSPPAPPAPVRVPSPVVQVDIDDENELLEFDVDADVVDTFALIDEALLLETDDLPELM